MAPSTDALAKAIAVEATAAGTADVVATAVGRVIA